MRPRKRRRFGACPVNELLAKPSAPGAWVDGRACSVCGEDYDRFNFFGSGPAGGRAAFEAGTRLVRAAGGEGGGFRSKGPVLWAARVLKLQAWYARHSECDRRDEPPPVARTNWSAWRVQLPAESPDEPLHW